MLRALTGRRGLIALVAFVALSGFLMCLLPPHGSHTSTPRGADTASVSTAAAHDSKEPQTASAPRSPAPQVGVDQPSGDQEHSHTPTPVCHTTSTHVMDVASPLAGLLLGLVGVLLGAVIGVARLDTQAGVAWGWSTRPPCRLSGFPLLITLCVSRP